MPAVRIAKLGDVSGLGLFKQCRSADSPDFRQYNLVYGFNGSGKTTLSRIFASLDLGTRCPRLPEEGFFSIHLTDGSTLRSDGDLSALRGRVVVFNSDFIEDSFLWTKGEARPVFYIGKEQRELAGQLEAKAASAAVVQGEQRAAANAADSSSRAFAAFKRNLARSVSEQLGLGRRYDASTLTSDYAASPAGGFKPLAVDELERCKALVSQAAAAPKIASVSGSKGRLKRLVERCVRALRTTVGELAVANLRGHDSMRSWLATGLKYHEDNQLSTCLLCGNEFSTKRRSDLATAIDGAYDALIRELTDCFQSLGAEEANLRDLLGRTPRPAEFSAAYVSRATTSQGALSNAIGNAISALKVLSQATDAKLKSPHEKHPDPDCSAAVQRALEAEIAIDASVESLSQLVEKHNVDVGRFDEAKREAADALRMHLLASSEQEYLELDRAHSRANEAKALADSAVAELQSELQKLRDALRSHGPAANVVNKLIHNYLGRTDLTLVTSEDGYRLRRDGRLVRGSLSEGEKTAIAICYFITTLGAEGRKMKDLIVVIDDPVSSLDSRALNYSFNVLRALVDDVCQVFLLTHNLHYMNQIRSWLRPKTPSGMRHAGKDPAGANAALLFLDVVQPMNAASRACALVELPKYIRDYESEYHYLLHMLFRFVDAKDAPDYVYLMPNAMRKVLDVFLAFKLPGPDGLGSKIQKAAKMAEGLDAARVYSLVTLAQVESHSDNLDDLISLSAPTVEEVRTAAETLLQLIQALDGSHLTEMKRLCA